MAKGTILIPVDHSPITKKVLEFTNQWTKKTGDLSLFLYAIKKNRIERAYSGFLDTILTQINYLGNYEETFPIGTPYLEIIKEERRIKPKMIVMASHTHSTMGRIFLGSNSDYVLHHSKSPVYLFKMKRRLYKNNILVPIDFTEVNKRVIKIADNWALNSKANLIFIHVNSEYEYEKNDPLSKKAIKDHKPSLSERLNSFILNQKIKSPKKMIVTFGNPYKKILACEEKYRSHLIMMASHSHTIARRFLMGGTTDKICHEAKCSVFVYKDTK